MFGAQPQNNKPLFGGSTNTFGLPEVKKNEKAPQQGKTLSFGQ